MSRIGPYSSPTVLAKLDGRTKEARLLQSVREELTEFVGGSPTVSQRAHIERAAWLTLHIALMDAKMVDVGEDGIPSDRDSRQYLAWSNSLTRTISLLGPSKPVPKAKRSLKDLISEEAAA